jgi:hypothetical protein
LSRVEDPEQNSERAAGAISPLTPFASQFETKAPDKADGPPRQPLDPRIVDRLTDFTRRELDRSGAPFGITGRMAATMGFLAIVALLIVIMMPSFQHSDTASSFTADVQQFTAALARQPQPQPPSDGAARPAIADFKSLLASSSERAAQPDQSDGLLRQFMQWREKAKPAANAQ